MMDIMNWIPVAEKLPGSDDKVLVCCKGIDEATIGWYDSGWDEWFAEYKLTQHRLAAITHWMPLPELPKGE